MEIANICGVLIEREVVDLDTQGSKFAVERQNEWAWDFPVFDARLGKRLSQFEKRLRDACLSLSGHSYNSSLFQRLVAGPVIEAIPHPR